VKPTSGFAKRENFVAPAAAFFGRESANSLAITNLEPDADQID